MHIHKWSDWIETPGKCERTKVCEKCEKTKVEAMEHIFDEWHYTKDGSCKMVRVCKRCLKQQEKEVHVFGEWYYFEEGSCSKRQLCKRCGAAQYKEECPTPNVYYEKDRCIKKILCPRCHDLRIESVEHQWVASIHNYKACVEYALKSDNSKLARIEEQKQICLKQSKGNTNDLKYYQLLIEEDELQKKKIEHSVMLDNSPDDMEGCVCSKCNFIKKLGCRSRDADAKIYQ